MNNERDKAPEVFDAELKRVCEQYADALRLYEEGAHLVSTDEKSGIQALERVHPPLPMPPGLIERQEHEYERHGTRCLFANLEVATGRIIASSIGPTRTNEDFASHIGQTIATDPEAEWIFVVDQLNIHQSEVLVKLVARACSTELELDRKGNLKLMKAMASRRTFLQDPTHRIRFVYTPKHTSWLNQIELWFSISLRAGYSSEAVSLQLRICVNAYSRSSSTSTELWPSRSSGPTKADRSRSKPMGYLHRDALVVAKLFLYDLAAVDPILRILLFCSFGAAFLLAAYLFGGERGRTRSDT